MNSPNPARLGAIKVEACGVCHSNAFVKEGHWPGIQDPRVPGHEVVLMMAPAIALALVSEDLSAVEAAPLMCAGITAYNALRNSNARPGDVVAIQGLGGLGHLGVQYAVKMGFKTAGIARGSDKKPLARKLGAHYYIDSQAQDPTAELQKLLPEWRAAKSAIPSNCAPSPRRRLKPGELTFDMVGLLESARAELATEHPEQYKIFLLGAMAGLRRNEIDVLPWTAFHWNEGLIRIETTEHYRPKSHNSEGDVLVDPELLELFRGYHARRKSDFVVESAAPPPAFDVPYGAYRCMNEMRALLAWLRAKGVVSKTPLHTLRKEFGSQIHARYGLLAASEALRHGGIGVTARH